MSLAPVLKTAIGNLRSGRLEREEQVKQAVILPILQELGWNPADLDSIKPEYPAGQGRVDYALLCYGDPEVFVEAKRRGALDAGAERQLFDYANNRGIPLLVLTDGYYWGFYLSMAKGPPEERRFRRLELRDDEKIPEYAEVLEACLRKQCVASGDVKRSAEKRLESDRKRKRARKAIPEAWSALSSEADERLCKMLAERVRKDTGVEPEPSDIKEFLVGLSQLPSLTGSPVSSDFTNRPPRFDPAKERTRLSGAATITPEYTAESTNSTEQKKKAIELVNSYQNYDILNMKNTHFSNINSADYVWWFNIPTKKFEQDLHLLCVKETDLIWLKIEGGSVRKPEAVFKIRIKKDRPLVDLTISCSSGQYMRDVKSGGSGYNFHPHIRQELPLSKKLN